MRDGSSVCGKKQGNADGSTAGSNRHLRSSPKDAQAASTVYVADEVPAFPGAPDLAIEVLSSGNTDAAIHRLNSGPRLSTNSHC